MGHMTFHIQHASLQVEMIDVPLLVENTNITFQLDRCLHVCESLHESSLFSVVYGA